ncbi:DUF411 domain-containing protein [Woeseia oceani]|uniref:Glutaredoxin domain-containing protein n=1 Tax=Woeseia oceani TaxID=1548547 RepID=A0A193LK17_9GAMM|nr:DUF411 domain-containing protein [Woeseia oceani]ANO52895.1 hypothetical protein BA177_01145 [Woeseia oceani]
MNNVVIAQGAARRTWVLLASLLFAPVVSACSEPGPQSMADTGADAEIVVYKTPYCGCCHKWVEQLERDGLAVDAVNVQSTASIQTELGVPTSMRSCHTAKVGDYWVEGHVPPDLVEKLLEDKPEGIRGLAVPGMPVGSPGMEGPGAEPYDVMQVHADGSASVYARREGREFAPE